MKEMPENQHNIVSILSTLRSFSNIHDLSPFSIMIFQGIKRVMLVSLDTKIIELAYELLCDLIVCVKEDFKIFQSEV